MELPAILIDDDDNTIVNVHRLLVAENAYIHRFREFRHAFGLNSGIRSDSDETSEFPTLTLATNASTGCIVNATFIRSGIDRFMGVNGMFSAAYAIVGILSHDFFRIEEEEERIIIIPGPR